MIVFRLTKAKYQNEISGVGAKVYGGRWNSAGQSMVYTCENRALCTTEIAVHTPLGIMPKNYVLQTIKIPDNAIKTVTISKLPNDWKRFPHPYSTKAIGDEFLKENSHLVFKIPSAIVQGEFNFLINPAHKNFSMVKLLNVEPFSFDKRLFN